MIEGDLATIYSLKRCPKRSCIPHALFGALAGAPNAPMRDMPRRTLWAQRFH